MHSWQLSILYCLSSQIVEALYQDPVRIDHWRDFGDSTLSLEDDATEVQRDKATYPGLLRKFV